MWDKLNEKEKIEFKILFDKIIGKTNAECETGETMYFDKDYNLINNIYLIKYMKKIKRIEKIRKLNKL
jgi:hypothetical protein